ncbi:hypothetical protein CAPTEDRAFT_228317 [Capitella teleta]|uniref:Uncharacterized protein n=1 Tax=Capitella teleta TaxID=283909 RepID=R7UWC9_CAPTE|nr:hypothetical protein CAPTEDRAFT_228317 [Capitella teleta]|eukprot:ELU10624.1 hypothetical protein CAPTEDRAFT_228317 [Capitella teleta]
MLSLELAALRLKKCPDKIEGDDQLSSIVQNLCSANYKDILKDDYLQAVFNIDAWVRTSDSGSLPDFERLCLDCISKAFEGCDNAEKQKRTFCLLAIAVSCVQLFAQNNWVGPSVDLPSWLSSLNEKFEFRRLPCSGRGGRLSQSLVSVLSPLGASYPFSLLRSFNVLHNYLLVVNALPVPAPEHTQRAVYVIEELTHGPYCFRDLAIEFHLEAGHLLYFFYEPSLSSEHFTAARQLSNLTIELTGAMGKRTRFQEKEVSQLVLRIQRNEEARVNFDPVSVETLPTNMPLDDDTLLEGIAFSDSAEQFTVPLQPFEEALVLGLCHLHRKTCETKGSILEEETMAYINAVLSQPMSWSIQSAALLHRTNWQLDSIRRMQRSLSQLEELVNQFKRSVPPAVLRLPFLYASNLPPQWEVERRYGEFLIKVGSTQTALDIFMRINMYEDVIKCYTSLGRREKAEEVIRARLAIAETDSLWCYLGDVTHNEEDYMRAWHLSKGRCARAQRSLGFLFLNKGEFEKCLPYFERSLKVNALQNHEAWNNLSSAYIRDGQKERAFVTLQEAIKLDFENWRVWENYLLLATDVGEFQEAMRSVNRMLDLRDKFSDVPVLKVFVRAVIEDIKDASGAPSGKLAPELKKLFGRITSKVTANGDIWRLYGELLLGIKDRTVEDLQRAVQYLQKSHRCATQVNGWEKDPKKCVEVADSMTPLVATYLQCAGIMQDKQLATQLLSSARLATKGVIAKIKQNHVDVVTNEMREDLNEPCVRLETLLQEIQSAIDERKS